MDSPHTKAVRLASHPGDAGHTVGTQMHLPGDGLALKLKTEVPRDSLGPNPPNK